jgi:hypothetical protein
MPAVAVLVDVGILLALAVLIGLRFGYTYTLGKVLLMSAALLNTVVIPTPFGNIRLLGFAADALLKADHAIMHTLGRGISDMQAAWNEAVSYTAQAVHWIGHEIAALAHDTASAVEGLHVSSVTNVYKKVNPGLAAKVGALAALVAALERRVTHVVTREVHAATAKVEAVTHAIAVPDLGALPRVIPRVKPLEDAASWGRGEIKRLARYLTPAGIIGLVGATTFGGFGLGWLRCKGVGRVGRSLCGASGLIEALYAGAITAFAVSDLCRFAHGIEKVAESIRPVMLDFVDVEQALFGCSAADYPKDFALAPVSPTPVFDAVAL